MASSTRYESVVKKIILALGAPFLIYHIVYSFAFVQAMERHLVVHAAGVIIIASLLASIAAKTKVKRYLVLACIPVALAPTIYAWINFFDLSFSIGYLSGIEFALGIGLIVAVFIVTWATWGIAIPVIIMVGLIYFFLGHLVPGAFYHPYFSPSYIISFLAMNTETGIYSKLCVVSSTMLVYVLIFGAMVNAMGPLPAFIEIAKAIGRKLAGGPAYLAWFSSSMVAMICGAGAANVAITGPFTIPAMKRHGFSPEAAGAIEASASIGGQITPPVMSTASFIMAALIGVSYFVIIQKAIFGALIFYLALFVAIFFFSAAHGLRVSQEKVDWSIVPRRLPIFLIPLGIAIYYLIIGRSVGYSFTIGILVALFFGLTLLRENRSIKVLLNALFEGCRLIAIIGIIMLAAGMLATVATESDLGPKMASAVVPITGGLALPTLVLCAITCIIFGMGMPGAAAYLIVALVVLPTLWQLGIDRFASHFFAFYFAVFAGLSPPYAPSAMVASQLAGGRFWPTGFLAIRFLSIPFILIPFAFVMHPELLDFPIVISVTTLWLVGLILVGVISITTGWFGWFICKTSPLTRAIAWLCGLGAWVGVIGTGFTATVAAVIAVGLLAVLTVMQIARARLARSATAPTSSDNSSGETTL